MHIGSQITDLKPFRDAFRLMRDMVLDLRREGHDIEHLDLGGGLGVPYYPAMSSRRIRTSTRPSSRRRWATLG